ncbi:glutamine amidotransferase [Thermosporothrix hazakensis]|jgi:glutamine amidotransferase|uniref:Imidazole glycerol phosphate synthase subunit HisH n=2 Tax=Thermosporothrix TaxID=768650 RepID=A0A326UIV1_THEHA|nr:imidazole glycerol phosphate synthase subunit HisH [Thermosporothrix hazakensis]PZW32058.1 glutamine amidotransferase [Thermosporothrix hazakensis]BBH91469.1 imidazole glycerol phosphate synthase subunit HisH [Thermosporothrix sp. COM3]GCE49614.1 imidazole glycerol phosphate synthase subunit HisH [Thermosporothrix hazakensis]
MIAIIDYRAGNIHSIAKALEYVGAAVQVTDDPAVVKQASAVVLPGVGAAGAAMAHMQQHGLDDAIREATQQGKPFLGICLGMQLLADHHAEGETVGLGLFPGEVRRIPHGPKIPHMGWNQVRPLRENLPIFAGIAPDSYFYYAHSYYVEPHEQSGVAAVTDYGSPYCSVIVTEQVWGTQFHPEKSGAVGLQLLKNFARWVQQ